MRETYIRKTIKPIDQIRTLSILLQDKTAIQVKFSLRINTAY